MRSPKGFWCAVSLTGFEDELNACLKIDPMTWGDEKRLHVLLCPENSTHFFSFFSNQFKTSF